MLTFLEQLCIAARFEKGDPRAILLAGRALAPDGFIGLQQPPLSLDEYFAARVLHECNRRKNKAPLDEMFLIEQAYAALLPELPPQAAKLIKYLNRCGALSDSHANAAALCSLWLPPTRHKEVLFLACNCVAEDITANLFNKLAISA